MFSENNSFENQNYKNIHQSDDLAIAVSVVCCGLPFDFLLERDPKNIFYYQREVENYTDQVLGFLLFDKHEYTHGIFRFAILVSIFMLRVYVTFSLFRINYFRTIAFQRNLLLIGL